MSEFDKEAEREKLREKYERDREKRKETERMSQLLLQGATMTNRHCGTCGDPLFRYEGNEFCATCEERVEETGGAADEATAQDAGTADAGAGADADEAAVDGTTTTVDGDAAGHPSPDAVGGDGESTPEPEAASEPTPPEPSREPSDAAGTPTSQSPADGQHRPAVERETAPEPIVAADSAGGDGDLDAARAALVRTITTHARRAEAADGPRRAADHLAAVREAAEALAALDGNRR
jgi:uncharacterized Zn finger protein (UPF0148 family)